MIIEFERSGGFTGMLITATLDTAALPPDEAQRVRDLVESAGFFDLPPVSQPPPEGADQFQYRVTIEDEERRHTVEITDRAASPELLRLLRLLTILARSAPD